MKKPRFIVAWFSAAVTAVAAAADATPPKALARDLGQGLVYHRIHQLPADLPTAETTRRQPCVLDLRYVIGDSDAAAALAAWLRFHATTRAPVLILANATTSTALIAPLAGPRPGASIVVIGGAAPGFTPDIVLKISAEAERAAYDALEHGVAIESLLAEKSDKPRNDEAKLARDRQADFSATDETLESLPAEGHGMAKPKAAPAPIDAALQRAVQLHRTLVALKKL